MPLAFESQFYYTILSVNIQWQIMANPHPTYKLTPLYGEAMAEKPVAVRLAKELDAYVRSLPNKTEWLREAIAEKYQRDLQEKEATTPNTQ